MKWCVLGSKGFIGSALCKELSSQGHLITTNPTPDIDVLVHLASPTHLKFQENVPYHMGESINSFQLLLPFCKENNIHFVYASSALTYEPEKKFALRNCKLILEQMAEAYGGKTLGLRIFPVYGPGEGTTAITQWCRQMMRGEHPEVYGDGTQERDFIYITDVVENIIRLVEEKTEGVVDIGGGHPVSFNDIITIINMELGTNLLPKYVGTPIGYSKGVVSLSPVPTRVSIEDGVYEIVRSLKW